MTTTYDEAEEKKETYLYGKIVMVTETMLSQMMGD